MKNFINECENTISFVEGLLKQNDEWISRYTKYANEIYNNLDTIRKYKNKFHEWAPLFLYMNITEAKGQMKFSLRYLGQDVAKLKVNKDKITISTKSFNEKNERDFGCTIELKDCEWRSKEARIFRLYFKNNPIRTNDSGKKNEEHRIESVLLTEFSKKKSKNKILCNIQPVKLAGIARFQMPTPIKASDTKKIEYSNSSGGGIDIISRVGIGKSTMLCIMEVKDENTSKEPPTKVIKQGLVYATFLRELLRSVSGEKWWKIFGYSGALPKELELYVACVVPSAINNDKSFADVILKINKDCFYLHYLYFLEKDNSVLNIVTSLK